MKQLCRPGLSWALSSVRHGRWATLAWPPCSPCFSSPSLSAQLLLLKGLPYSSCLLSRQSARVGPFPNFRIGSLHWPVEQYAQAELDFLRDYYRSICPAGRALQRQ